MAPLLTFDVTSRRPFQIQVHHPSSSFVVVFTSELSVTVIQHVGEKRALTREQKLPSVRTHRGVFRRRCATRLLHRYEIGSVAVTRVVVAKCAPIHPSIRAQPFVCATKRTHPPRWIMDYKLEERTRWTDDDDDDDD
jgi:hypothetical protein